MAGAKVFWKATMKEKSVVAPGVLTRKTSVENGSVEATPGDALPGGEKRAAVCEMPRDAPAAEVDVSAPPAGKKKGVKSAGKALRDKPFKGTSAYKGVAQHRVTRRWESHVWEAKKQLYLGSFAEEVEAARAYDRAAIYLGKPDSELNFSFADYASEAETLRKMTKGQLLAQLRRASTGFSWGSTRFRGVSYRSRNGRFEARISGVVENKYTYLGTYDRPEDAAAAFDRAAIALRGRNAVTNYDIQNYEKEIEQLTNLTKLSQSYKSGEGGQVIENERWREDVEKRLLYADFSRNPQEEGEAGEAAESESTETE
mmetsp:Transcript_2592/g.9547  ORF Transcript_2592/g.9547 Transcript_2592/m.9547 type:complete len:314 (-) Transcript_2592:61-1002(-)